MFVALSDLGDPHNRRPFGCLLIGSHDKSDIDWIEHLHPFARTNKVWGDFFFALPSVPTENPRETWSHGNVSYCYTL